MTLMGGRSFDAIRRLSDVIFISATSIRSRIFFLNASSRSNVIGVVSCMLSGFVASIISYSKNYKYLIPLHYLLNC